MVGGLVDWEDVFSLAALFLSEILQVMLPAVNTTEILP